MDTDFLHGVIDGTPFAFGKIAVKDTFVNRTDEKKQLALNFANKVNTILISPRRWGKSSLVKEVGEAMHKRDKKYRFAYIDLFSVRTENEFLEAYAQAVIKCTSGRFDDWISNTRMFLKTITPKISIDGDVNHEFSLSLDLKDVRQNTETILNLANTIAKDKGLHIVLCIDEFQNIATFTKHVAFQKKLRSYWQHHQHATYCLYGSKRSMLMQMFEKNAMPFYRFGEIMYLTKIDAKHWLPFIISSFKKTSKKITPEQAALIVKTMQCHPYYIQQFCYLIWTRCGKVVKDEDLLLAMRNLINQNANLFEREIESMSKTKINVLKAIADGHSTGLSSAAVIAEFNLGSSANATKTLKILDMEEIVDKQNGQYSFIDPTFELWFKERILGKNIYKAFK
jgi:AAA+ ATPase superfamily predicted ATPase